MANATIGSANIILGMDAGDFESGAKKVEASINKLAAKFGFIAGVAAEAGRALLQSMGGVLSALGERFTAALNNADALDEFAEKLGITAESLSALRYAAEAVGTPFETLIKAGTDLAASMAKIAGGDTKSDVALAFQALGISATTATGQIRPLDTVLLEIATKFASFENDANKTALAVALFGQKVGPQLIPLLNQGAAGIEELTAKARELGLITSNETAAGAAKLNDSLVQLSKQIDAGFTRVLEALLPAIQAVVDWLLSFTNGSRAAEIAISTLSAIVRVLATAFITVSTAISVSTQALIGFGNAAIAFQSLNFSGIGKAWTDTATGIKQTTDEAALAIGRLWGAMQQPSGAQGAAAAAGREDGTQATGDTKSSAPIVQQLAAQTEATKARTLAQTEGNTAQAEWNKLRSEAKQIEEDLYGPSEKLAQQQSRLNELLKAGAISAETYGKAMQKATAVSVNAYAGMASGIADNLSKAFGDSKAFAIAAAIINTAEAVTKTLATYGATPWGFAAAAAAAAAGLAQVRSIQSTNKNSSSGSSSTSASVNSTASEPTQQQGIYVNLQGSGKYSREEVIGLIEQINEAQKDGNKLVVTS
jgi:hypothetical protein